MFLVLALTFFIIMWLVIFPQNIMKVLYPLKYNDFVLKYSEQFEIDPYLVMAIMKAESSFRPKVVSHKGAKGLMQLTDQTAQWGAEQLELNDFTIEKLFEPETNIMIGCWYLDKLKKEFNNNLKLVVAAYNGGSGNVSKWLKDKNLSSSGKTLDTIPFKETDHYVKKVIKDYTIYKKLYGKKK
jgi:soluble lytic murein transglycosylase